MKYLLSKENTSVQASVPGLLLDRLDDFTDTRIRILLTICKMGGECTPHSLYNALKRRYAIDRIEKELHYLEGAGVVVTISEQATAKNRNISRLETEPVGGARSKPEDVMLLAATSNEMKSLVRLAQDILGKTLSGGDITILANLMFCEGMSVEMLALGIAHCAVEKNKPNIRYIDKVMRGWLEAGVTDLPSAELYLEDKDREQKLIGNACALIGVEKAGYAESLLIIKWYKEYQYDDKMLKEAILFAGEKCSIRYINGIFKRWHEQNYKTVKDVRAANIGGANVNTVKKIESKDDVMIKRRSSVPVFRKADS